MRRFVFCSFYYSSETLESVQGLYWFEPIKDRRESFFLIKEHLRIHSPTLNSSGSDDCHAFHYTEHSHYVNRLLSSIFMLSQAGIMPCCKHKTISRYHANDKTWENMASKASLLRYIAIHRYINIRAKSGHTTIPLHSNKGHSGQPRAMIFGVVSPYTANGIFLHHAVKSRYRLTK